MAITLSEATTFLFTDIEGSTRLWREYPGAMPAAYARHDAIIHGAVRDQDGVVFKTIGDAIQAAFPTARQAAASALMAQRALQDEPWEMPEPLRVRMAIHTGNVVPQADGDYRSPELNQLGRLLDAAHGGQILLSDATANALDSQAPPGAMLLDLGLHRFRDLHSEVRVWQLVAPCLNAGFPEISSLGNVPGNLPAQPNAFIGREGEIIALGRLLRDPAVRLLTLTGPGGIGKTRLAIRAASGMAGDFPDGVFFVTLDSLSDVSLVPATVAQVLEVRADDGVTIAEALQRFLKDRRLLLVLDNLEHLLGTVPFMQALLSCCPLLTILATSRARLHMSSEHEYPVPPLPVPDPTDVFEVIREQASVQLFVARARSARPGFQLTAENAQVISSLCRRLDGLPLAVELAAARIRLLELPALLDRLSTRLPVLTGGPQDVPSRQRTLRGTIQWSYDLLDPLDQALFRALSVFAGGFSLDAAAAIADDSTNILDRLGGLVDHSLIRMLESTSGPRFTMLETIREFGRDRLGASPGEGKILRRHAEIFLDLARTSVRPLADGVDRAAWLNRLDEDHDNIRAALGWAIENDPSMALEFGAALGFFWNYGDYPREGELWLGRCLAAAPVGMSEPDGPARAKCLTHRSYLAWARGDAAQAFDDAGDALDIARSCGDRELEAEALRMRGGASQDLGTPARGIADFTAALAIYRELGDARRAIICLNNIGVDRFLSGVDLPEAYVNLREALAGSRALGDPILTAHILINLAEYQREHAGDFLAASDSCREALHLLWKERYLTLLLHALAATAIIASRTDHDEVAVRLFAAVDALSAKIGASIPVSEESKREEALAAIERRLGNDVLEQARDAGSRMPVDEAVGLAIGVLDALGTERVS